jgi:hypothetical protein
MPLTPTRPMSRFMISLAVCLAMSKARGGEDSQNGGPHILGFVPHTWALPYTCKHILFGRKTGHICKHYYHGKI